MKLEDVVEIIKADIVNHIKGPFIVKINSDDGGKHIEIIVGHDEEISEIHRTVRREHPGSVRMVWMKVPETYFDEELVPIEE